MVMLNLQILNIFIEDSHITYELDVIGLI